MPELKLGSKFECYNCSTKFYDLGKSSALCPKCGADQKDGAQSDSSGAGQASRRRRKAEVPKAIEIEDEEPIEAIADDEMVEPELEESDLGSEAEEELDEEE
jgi:uncharacterized protein (TIGR02300 family)